MKITSAVLCLIVFGIVLFFLFEPGEKKAMTTQKNAAKQQLNAKMQPVPSAQQQEQNTPDVHEKKEKKAQSYYVYEFPETLPSSGKISKASAALMKKQEQNSPAGANSNTNKFTFPKDLPDEFRIPKKTE